jgi:heme exporter protein B
LKERTNDTLSALRLSVGDPFAIFLAKLVANVCLLLITELLALPLFAVFFNVKIMRVFPQLMLVFLLGSSGIAVTGTALSAISSQARMRELLLPMLLLPLLVPILLASTEATAALLGENPALRWDWLAILAAFDLVFLTALWLFGEYLLEE